MSSRNGERRHGRGHARPAISTTAAPSRTPRCCRAADGGPGRRSRATLERASFTSWTTTPLALCVQELDTVSDFVEYLVAKESFAGRPAGVMGAEEDILAMFLANNRSLPSGDELFIVDPGYWTWFSREKPYLAKKEADKPSYKWDYLIELLSRDFKSRLPGADAGAPRNRAGGAGHGEGVPV